MNGYFFDQALNSEYSAYRMHAPLLLPSSPPSAFASTSAFDAAAHNLHHQHTSPLSTSYGSDIATSPWDIAAGATREQHAQQHQPAQVTPKARDAAPAAAPTGLHALRSLNARHRAQLRALIDNQDFEELGATLGVPNGPQPAEDHSLRHSIQLQDLIVELGNERNALLGRMVNEGSLEAPASLLPAQKAEDKTPMEMNWSSEDSDVVRLPATSHQDFSAVGSGFESSPSSSWSNQAPLAAELNNGAGLVFGQPMQRTGTMESSDDDLLFDLEVHSRRSSFGSAKPANVFSPQAIECAHPEQHASHIQLPPTQKTSPRPKPASSRSREPRVAFSCDACAKMKKPCKKPLGPAGLVNPIGDCVRCANHGKRFGKPVHCTYLRSQERIVKSRHQGQLIRDDCHTADVG